MKQIIALFLILFAAPVFAAPFLVCDPQPDAERYELTLDGTVISTPAPLKYDLAGIAQGSHKVTAVAINDTWGVRSEPSAPFDCFKPLLQLPSGFRLER
jgi:hypothetical protein